MRRVVVLVNGACAAAAATVLLPGAFAWPMLAGALARRHPDAVGLDALLCFGPLALPTLLAASVAALRTGRVAPNAAAAWAWIGLGLVGGGLVVIG